MNRTPYGRKYRLIRAGLLGLPCELQLVCEGDPADSADHTPPLSRHVHVEGTDCCSLRPACLRCQAKQARLLAGETAHRKRLVREGYVFEDDAPSGLVQSVEWL